MQVPTKFFLGLLFLPVTAGAVALNPRGLGQALIFPYYTVNGGNTTLISIANSTASGKALKLRFHEAYNGRAVLTFNIYLSPFDAWTAGIFQLDADGPANLVTDDSSCTSPRIKTSFALPTLPDRRHYVAFRNGLYAGADEDGGPTHLARSREGFFEVIEMAEVTNAMAGSLSALIPDPISGVPANCPLIDDRARGYWINFPENDMAVPRGGLFGSAAIVNVADGTMATYIADALDGFSDRIQNSTGDSLHPGLDDAVTDSVAGIASAYISVGTGMLRADYPAPSRGIDAVSAVLATQTLINEFVELSGGAAHSEWVVSQPTKQFYVNSNYVLPPYLERFSDHVAGMSRVPVDPTIRSREGRELRAVEPLVQLGAPDELAYQTQVVSFSRQIGSLSPILGSKLTYAVFLSGPNFSNATADTGWLRIDFRDFTETHSSRYHRMRPALGGEVILGLPVVGFLLTNYTNTNATPGVLANYSGTFPHRTQFGCIRRTAGSVCDVDATADGQNTE